MSTPWLTNVSNVLSVLEKLDAADTSPAGFAALGMATAQLAALTTQVAQLSGEERRAAAPHLAQLQQRIANVVTKMTQAKAAAPDQLKNLRHHGQALGAYLTSDNKK